MTKAQIADKLSIGLAAKATLEQRTAQRQIVALLNRDMRLDLTGISIYRDDGIAKVYDVALSQEIEDSLDELRVPHIRQPVTPDRRGVGPAYELTIAWSDIDALARWAPSAAMRAIAIHQQMPTSVTEAQTQAHRVVRQMLGCARIGKHDDLVFNPGTATMGNIEQTNMLTEALDKLEITYLVGLIGATSIKEHLRNKKARFCVSVPAKNLHQLQTWFPHLKLS